MHGRKSLTFLEFFAGGGLVRAGLGDSWRCLFANDIDPKKCAAYRANFGSGDLVESDISGLSASDLPRVAADLAWASFPCQDLSLAGARAGLNGARSGLFFEFWRLIAALAGGGRAPRIIVIENVTGLLTSSGGADFAALVDSLRSARYRVSAAVIDARAFLPQSRQRLFVFGFSSDLHADFSPDPNDATATPALQTAVAKLSPEARADWRWLSATPRDARNTDLASLLDPEAPWRTDFGKKAVRMMSDKQRKALAALQETGRIHIGAAFRRVRIEGGVKAQRIEARFDGIAGCLRTPSGGSSRQILVRVEGDSVRARWLAPREAARLMGLPDDYVLPGSATDALKICGDGVAVPVARWIGEAILAPALCAAQGAT